MSYSNKNYGDNGEIIAEEFLTSNGFKIIVKNFRYGKYGEIDIIACNEDITLFVEVKRRSTKVYGGPLYSLNNRKLSNLKKTAMFFLSSNNFQDIPQTFRFDLIAIEGSNVQWVKDIIN